ncbi:hypothetical protein [Enterococcus sp. AZ163]|uniref:hypothetical protein n=1 Tax=Enterococcus sp. AZ163 TaxID=2774638 RepID=UPI003D2A2572
MYEYVWLTSGISGIMLFLFLFFLIKDLAFHEKMSKKKWYYLLPNWLLFTLTLCWGALSILLYFNIQTQLGG